MAQAATGLQAPAKILRILPSSSTHEPSQSNVSLNATEKFVDLKFSAHPSNGTFNIHMYDTGTVTPGNECVYIAQSKRPNLRFFRTRWAFEVRRGMKIEKGDALTCDWDKIRKQMSFTNRMWRAKEFAAYLGEVEDSGWGRDEEVSTGADGRCGIEAFSEEEGEQDVTEHDEESGGAAVGIVGSLYEDLEVLDQSHRKRAFMEKVRNAAALSRGEETTGKGEDSKRTREVS